MLRLLCVTAHPDDEAGGFGGSLLVYRARGVETFVVCLTPGQAARNRGGAKNDAELSAVRREEFARACKILNISRGEVLDYPDAALDRQDFQAVAGVLVRRIREIRPQVVATFGAEGAITAHPDHTMASLLATAAYHWAGRSNRFTDQLDAGLKPHRAQKLYYASALATIPDYPQPVSLAPVTTVIDIGAQNLDTKIAAFAAHTSQNPLLPRFEATMRDRGPVERFHLAATTTPRMAGTAVETDLFAGVREDE
ncbi:MAG: PIG-L family deacetylase [Candidatus Koribacter versatilis]|uniref:PIG-L family deacetylase n=1 Tax=Candidatus Korobacter versatilis TaxID=658062 RepID=A0A932A9I1_9BACT|nr:PIG-L family deacetylase [Candidatus Koribacter versatilis]